MGQDEEDGNEIEDYYNRRVLHFGEHGKNELPKWALLNVTIYLNGPPELPKGTLSGARWQIWLSFVNFLSSIEDR